jgi:hypothetical protein
MLIFYSKLKAGLTESFRENYPCTTVIIDCAETFIQRPTNLKTRSKTSGQHARIVSRGIQTTKP